MFAAVMEDTENCKGLLEMVLEFPVARIELSTEKSIIHHPQYHGVRLDVYAKGMTIPVIMLRCRYFIIPIFQNAAVITTAR